MFNCSIQWNKEEVRIPFYNLITKAEKYLVYSGNFQTIFRSLYFRSSWSEHRLK